jgi:hypothetical protein
MIKFLFLIKLSVAVSMILILMVFSPSSALMEKMDDITLVSGADGIVIGDVLSVSSAWNSDHTHIITTALVHINETMKGDLKTGQVIPIITEGGTVGEITEWVEDQSILMPGSQVGLFLEKESGSDYSIYGLFQGVIPIYLNSRGRMGAAGNISRVKARIQRALNGSSSIVENALSEPDYDPGSLSLSPVITSVTPGTASAGTETVITIFGSGFGSKANRYSNADVGFSYQGSTDIYATGWPLFSDNVNDIVSWSDTMIQVKVPTGICPDGYPGSASSGYLYISTDSYSTSPPYPFTVTFGYSKSEWSSNPTYYVNPSPYTTAIIPAINRAGTTWGNAGTSFQFNYGGTTTGVGGVSDGMNIMSWGDLATGVIGQATYWYSGGVMSQCDIVFNTDYSWVTTNTASGSQMNTETIALHELGHWLSLRDLYGVYSGYPQDLGKIMFGVCSATYGNKNQVTLHPTDIAGIQWIYGAAGTSDDRIGSFLDGWWYFDQDKSGTVSGGDVTSGPFGTAAGVKPVIISNHLAVFLNGFWYIDANGNGYWDGYDAITGPFGAAPGAVPLIIGGHKAAFLNGFWYIDQDDSGTWSGGDALCGPFGAASGAVPLIINGHKAAFLNGYWYIDMDDSGTWCGADQISGPFGTASGAVPFLIDNHLAVFLNGYWYIDTDNSGTPSSGDSTIGPFGTAAGATPFVNHQSTGSTSVLPVQSGVFPPDGKTPAVKMPGEVPQVDIPMRRQMSPVLIGNAPYPGTKNPLETGTTGQSVRNTSA